MNTFSTYSFDDLRNSLGRGDGPISMSDMYNVDAAAPRSGPINIRLLGPDPSGKIPVEPITTLLP